MSITDTILAAIGTGEDNAVHTKDLQLRTGLSERELRKTIETLRREGHVIVSCDRGYYYPGTAAEVKRHIKKEDKRARSIMFTLRSARELLRNMEDCGGNE